METCGSRNTEDTRACSPPRCSQRGADVICAWGGDGTVNEVGSVLAFGDAALAVVPAGSGNGLARALGIPRRPALALRHALGAPGRRIDVGEIAGHLFLNIAGVGFDAHIASEFSRGLGQRGFRRYARIVTRELFAYTPRQCRVTIGTTVTDHRAFLLTIANGPQWGNGAVVAPRARLDDGLLDLVTVESPSRLQLLASVPRLFARTVDRSPPSRSGRSPPPASPGSRRCSFTSTASRSFRPRRNCSFVCTRAH